jgi:hypothetical protein
MAKNSEAKVIKIIDDYTVVLNKGKKDNMNEGDKYIVFYYGADDIIDEETKENLGKIEYIIGKGIITHVQENMSQLKSMTKEITKNKKIIRTSSAISYLSKEEVVEEPEERMIPFENPQVGYYARKMGL